MSRVWLLYIGAVGAALAVIAGVLAQGLTSGLGAGAGNMTSLLSPGANASKAAEALREALPEIEDRLEKAKPYLMIQFAGYVLFAVGFLGIWRVTGRGLGLVACLCLVLAAATSTASYLMVPSGLKQLADALEASGGTQPEIGGAVPSLLAMAGLGFVSLVGILGGALSGGYEFYRIGRELEHDFLRGSGALLMAGAVLSFMPFVGGVILYLAIASVGASFHLLARRISETREEATRGQDPQS